MTYRFGGFTFPTGDEPERWDYTSVNAIAEQKLVHTPYTFADVQGLATGALVIQGYTLSRTNYDSLMAEMRSGGQKVATVDEWDGTERKFFGIAGGQAKQTAAGQRKGVYDYVISLSLFDPFKYESQYQYLTTANNASVSGGLKSISIADTTFNFSSTMAGGVYSHPIFQIRNDSGVALTDFVFRAGNTTSTQGNRIEIALGDTFANGEELYVFPIQYKTDQETVVYRNTFKITGTVNPTSTDLRIMNVSGGLTSTFESETPAHYQWPQILSGTSSTIKCQTSTGTVKIGMQWRRAY